MIVDTLKNAPAPFTGTEIHTLPNGMKFILKPDAGSPAVSIQAWARCGAIDESPHIYGISHGLEHMVFKGTPTRSAGEITRSIESQGGAINAATQLETTHYYIEVPAYGATAALDVLIDTILHPTFPTEELERERLVILEEIHRRDDNPDATLWDEFSTSVFKNTPYAIKVIGNEKTVSAMSREDLSTYYKTHYVPSKLCFVVAGGFDKGKVLGTLRNAFENVPVAIPPKPPTVNLENWAPQKQSMKKPVQTTYIGTGFPTIGLGHSDTITLDLLSDILGGGSSSRLFQSLREETESVLSISCDYIPFTQKGLFAFFLDTLPKKANNALDELFSQLEKLKKNPIKPEELARAKARTKSDWLMGSETPRGQASTLGSLSALGQLDLVTSYLPKIEALTVDDLMKAAEQHLFNQEFSLTRIEPAK